ncbi:MAG TPA: ribonuclease R [Gammaproteobacteria bacterium]|nr:ribonuclease R [Gammaproteobacteria bacterium]
MSKRARKKDRSDPYAEREATKYDRPIPSREFIMEMLGEKGVPLVREEIAQVLALESEDDLEALRRRLNAMERDGQLIRNRRNGYCLVDKADLVRGRIIGHPDGFGFLVPDEGGDDLFLGPRQMRSVLHGDRAVARVTGIDRRGRREGSIVEVLEHNTRQVVGRFYSESGIGFVVPDNKRLSQDIVVPPAMQGEAQHGQIVTIDLIEQPSKHAKPIGRVVEVLGDHMAPGMEIDVAIRSHELPLQWPEGVQAEIAGLGEEVPEQAKANRVDLRNTPLVTIDGADARDFDDAIYCERKPKGWRLVVAIADVSHYVSAGSALDLEAYERGNSVYFPERVVPMLPEVLSNGLCSLNPNVDRLCMVCDMYINAEGNITRSSFYDAVMRSHARLTYDQVAAMLVDGDSALREKYSALVPHLEELYGLYKTMRGTRSKRGAIDFETTETRIAFGGDRKIERIVPVVRNDAHKIIEECMIAANVATARFLARHKVPTLYRVHEGPKADKLPDVRSFLAEVGMQLGGGDSPEPKHYAKLLDKVQHRPDAHLIQTVLLRSLAQAVYSPDNSGHFGLAHDNYVHFTSPIRRYPDLLVHRAVRHAIARKEGAVRRAVRRVTGRGSAKGFQYTHDDMVVYGEHCSMTERRADEATRDAVDWLKCEYMLDKVGEVYDGIITSVTSFGIFVELADIYVEGLVHVTALKNDYYHFDPAKYRLMGERTATSYRLADRVRVRVVRVDLDERKIDFDLEGTPVHGGAQERSPKSGGKKRRGPGKRASTKKAGTAGAESKSEGGPKARGPRKKSRRRSK